MVDISEFDELITAGYRVEISKYISGGWETFSSYMGGFIGYYVIVFFISLFVGLVPILGALASLAIAGPLQAGYYLVIFKKRQGQEVDFGDFFAGFNYFLPLFLFTLVSTIFIILGFFLLIIPAIYLSVAYSFAIPLIVDRKLDFWQAMEVSRKVVTKKWFSMFLFLILLALINIAGLLGLIIGIIFTGPLVVCAFAAAYEGIFGIKSIEFPKI